MSAPGINVEIFDYRKDEESLKGPLEELGIATKACFVLIPRRASSAATFLVGL